MPESDLYTYNFYKELQSNKKRLSLLKLTLNEQLLNDIFFKFKELVRVQDFFH